MTTREYNIEPLRINITVLNFLVEDTISVISLVSPDYD
jgi:hypothetical protein